MNDLLNFIKSEYRFDGNVKFLFDRCSVSDLVSKIIELTKTRNSYLIEILTFTRDVYIGSDLNDAERESYLKELIKQNFFEELNKLLYSKNLNIASYSIYTFGKLSHKENSNYLESAYERKFKRNPILAYRCLNELEWLESKKVDNYIAELAANEDPISKLILLYLFEISSNHTEISKILDDDEFQNFINSNSTELEIIFKKLMDFENYFFQETLDSQVEDFEKFTKDYFLKT